MDTNNETIFYQDNWVTVTPARYVTQSKTYTMRNISSVHIFEIVKSKVKAILLILIGLAALFSKDIFYVGIILIPLGVWWFISIKNEYASAPMPAKPTALYPKIKFIFRKSSMP